MYFSHDDDARNDENVLMMRMELGAEGYGIYWMLIEKLTAEKTHVLKMNLKMLAWDLRCTEDALSKVINSYGLFEVDTDENLFWSNGLMSRLDKATNLSQVRSEAGKAGVEAKRRKANALKMCTDAYSTTSKTEANDKQNVNLLEQNLAKQNKIKGKEIKENSSSSKTSLSEASSEQEMAADAAEEEAERNSEYYEVSPFMIYEKAMAEIGALRMPPGTTQKQWERIKRALTTPKDKDRKTMAGIITELIRNGKDAQDIIFALNRMNEMRPLNELPQNMMDAVLMLNTLCRTDRMKILNKVGLSKDKWKDLCIICKEMAGNDKIKQPGRFILSRLKT